jgi:hypothetical protein
VLGFYDVSVAGFKSRWGHRLTLSIQLLAAE